MTTGLVKIVRIVSVCFYTIYPQWALADEADVQYSASESDIDLFDLSLDELRQIHIDTLLRSVMGVHHTLTKGLVCFGIYSAYMDMNDSVAPFIRLSAIRKGKISGADQGLDATLVHTADPNLQGGKRLDLSLGVNVFLDKRRYRGLRVNLELTRPHYQDLNGAQLETDLVIQGNIMYAF